MAVIINIMNPGYLTPLFQTAFGQKMLGTAVFFGLVGIFVIQRIVKPRY